MSSEIIVRVVQPVHGGNAEQRQRIVDQAVIVVEHPFPHEADRRDGRDHRQEIARLEQTLQLRARVEQRGEEQRQHRDDRHDEQNVQRRVAQTVEEIRVMKDLGVVPETDAGEFAGHQAVVLPERQQNDIDERIDGEDQKTDEKREQEQPRLSKGAEGHALAVCARAQLAAAHKYRTPVLASNRNTPRFFRPTASSAPGRISSSAGTRPRSSAGPACRRTSSSLPRE